MLNVPTSSDSTSRLVLPGQNRLGVDEHLGKLTFRCDHYLRGNAQRHLFDGQDVRLRVRSHREWNIGQSGQQEEAFTEFLCVANRGAKVGTVDQAKDGPIGSDGVLASKGWLERCKLTLAFELNRQLVSLNGHRHVTHDRLVDPRTTG